MTEWVETHSGLYIDVGDPDPGAIEIGDIAHALSMQCRFNGHCAVFYSVAEHSVHVAEHLENTGETVRVQLLGLLHDAAEAYVGDVVSGVKSRLERFAGMEHYVQRAVYESLSVPPPNAEEERLVKDADLAVLLAEAKVLMPSRGEGWCAGKTVLAAEVDIYCDSPGDAKGLFSYWWRKLTK